MKSFCYAEARSLKIVRVDPIAGRTAGFDETPLGTKGCTASEHEMISLLAYFIEFQIFDFRLLIW